MRLEFNLKRSWKSVSRQVLFKREIKIATMDKEHLMREAKFLKPALLGKTRTSMAPAEETKKLFEITCNEASDKGIKEKYD